MLVEVALAGMIGSFGVLILVTGILATGLVNMIIDAEMQEDNEKDYVYMSDGTPVEFNEEEQE